MSQQTPHLYNVKIIPRFRTQSYVGSHLQLKPEEVTAIWKTIVDSFQRYADHIQCITLNSLRYVYNNQESYNPLFMVSFTDLHLAREFALGLVPYTHEHPTISYEEEISPGYPYEDDE